MVISEGDERGSEIFCGVLAPDHDVVFGITGESKEGSPWDSVLLDAAGTDSVNHLAFAPWETLSRGRGWEG